MSLSGVGVRHYDVAGLELERLVEQQPRTPVRLTTEDVEPPTHPHPILVRLPTAAVHRRHGGVERDDPKQFVLPSVLRILLGREEAERLVDLGSRRLLAFFEVVTS